MSRPIFKGSTSTTTTGTTIGLVVPTGVSDGDLLLAFASHGFVDQLAAFGWTDGLGTILMGFVGGAYTRVDMLYRTAAASDSGQTVTFGTLGGSGRIAGGMLAYENASIGGFGAWFYSNEANWSSVIGNTLTPIISGGLLMFFGATRWDAVNSTPGTMSVPYGMTSRLAVNHPTGRSLIVCDEPILPDVATFGRTSACGGPDIVCGGTFVLRGGQALPSLAPQIMGM